MVKGHNQRGTIFLSEYAVTFFLVIAVVTAMAVYVQRAFQARLRDARHYMIENVKSVCTDGDNVNCLRAAGNSIGGQYEPYYTQVSSAVNREDQSQKGLLASGAGTSGIFVGKESANNLGSSWSNQLPPVNAVNDQVLGN